MRQEDPVPEGASVGGVGGKEDIPELRGWCGKFDRNERAFGVEDWRTDDVSVDLFRCARRRSSAVCGRAVLAPRFTWPAAGGAAGKLGFCGGVTVQVPRNPCRERRVPRRIPSLPVAYSLSRQSRRHCWIEWRDW